MFLQLLLTITCLMHAAAGRSLFASTFTSFTTSTSSSSSQTSSAQSSHTSSSSSSRFRPLSRLQVVHEINSLEDFEQYIANTSQSSLPVIIDYQKGQCKPCTRAAPVFEALSDQYADKAKFYKLDADQWSGALALMKIQGVKSVPTFQIWQHGQRLHSVAGAKALEDFEQLLVTALGNK